MFFGAWSDADDCITCAEALQEQKALWLYVCHPQAKCSSSSGEDYIFIPVKEKQ